MPVEQLPPTEQDVLEARAFPPAERYELLCGVLLPELKRTMAADMSLEAGPLAGRAEVTQLPLYIGDKVQPWPAKLHYEGVENVAILDVPQCALVDIATDGIEPYVHFTMSVCSALVASDPVMRRLVVAHLGLSEPQQAEAALRLFRQKGIRPENIHAVISQGQKEKESNYFPLEEYLSQGIPRENCHPFVFEFGNDGGQNGLVEILAGGNGMLISTFDIPGSQEDLSRIDENSRRGATFIPLATDAEQA